MLFVSYVGSTMTCHDHVGASWGFDLLRIVGRGCDISWHFRSELSGPPCVFVRIRRYDPDNLATSVGIGRSFLSFVVACDFDTPLHFHVGASRGRPPRVVALIGFHDVSSC